MVREARVLLWDAQAAASAIMRFVTGRSLQDYAADLLLRSAIERQCEIVGEPLRQLERHAPDIAARIPQARQAVAFRNRLAHGYATLDDAVVWQVAIEEMPRLAAVLDGLLRELDQG